METKTKVIIGVSVALVVITAFATKKYWLPKKVETAPGKPETAPGTGGVLPKPTTPKPSSYDVTTDKDYAAKMVVLKGLFNKTMGADVAGSVINKGDNYNKLATFFLPISLSDLKIYSNAKMTDSNSPINIGKADIIRNKYPDEFSQIQALVSMFSRGVDGSFSINQLPNGSLSNI